jgi:hypothetical protein
MSMKKVWDLKKKYLITETKYCYIAVSNSEWENMSSSVVQSIGGSVLCTQEHYICRQEEVDPRRPNLTMHMLEAWGVYELCVHRL